MQGDEETDCPAPYSALHIYINEIREYIKFDRDIKKNNKNTRNESCKSPFGQCQAYAMLNTFRS